MFNRIFFYPALFLISAASYADNSYNINQAVSQDEAISIVNFIAQGSPLGITVTHNVSIRGTFESSASSHLTKIDITALSFEALVDQSTITVPDSVKISLSISVPNGLCRNLTVTHHSVESTDSFITQGMKQFLNDHIKQLAKEYVVERTHLAQYCTDIVSDRYLYSNS